MHPRDQAPLPDVLTDTGPRSETPVPAQLAGQLPAAVAEAVGFLVDRAKLDRKGVFWSVGTNFRQANPALFENTLGFGTPGILLTLLEYYRRTQDTAVAELLHKGGAWVVHRMLNNAFQHGFYGGTAGLWHLFTELEKDFPGIAPQWFAHAHAALATCTRGDHAGNLVTGVAGTILGALDALDRGGHFGPEIQPLLADLLAAAKPCPEGVFWDFNPTSIRPPAGFLQGNAGVDYCLAHVRNLYGLAYAPLLAGSLDYARSLFDPEKGNWLDQDAAGRLRQMKPAEVEKMVAKDGAKIRPLHPRRRHRRLGRRHRRHPARPWRGGTGIRRQPGGPARPRGLPARHPATDPHDGRGSGASGRLAPARPARAWGVDPKVINFDRYFHLGLRDVPELILSPRALDFPRTPAPNQHYVGLPPDLNRQEVASDYRFNRIFERMAGQRAEGHPLVYCSLGTGAWRYAGAERFLHRVIEAARGQRWNLILTAGEFPLEQFADLPPNVAVFQIVPQLTVLRQADLMITHGGMNSITECALLGVPMLVYPGTHEIDLAGNAARVLANKVGLKGDLCREATSALHSKIQQILFDPVIRTRLVKLRTQLVSPRNTHSSEVTISRLLSHQPRQQHTTPI